MYTPTIAPAQVDPTPQHPRFLHHTFGDWGCLTPPHLAPKILDAHGAISVVILSAPEVDALITRCLTTKTPEQIQAEYSPMLTMDDVAGLADRDDHDGRILRSLRDRLDANIESFGHTKGARLTLNGYDLADARGLDGLPMHAAGHIAYAGESALRIIARSGAALADLLTYRCRGLTQSITLAEHATNAPWVWRVFIRSRYPVAVSNRETVYSLDEYPNSIIRNPISHPESADVIDAIRDAIDAFARRLAPYWPCDALVTDVATLRPTPPFTPEDCRIVNMLPWSPVTCPSLLTWPEIHHFPTRPINANTPDVRFRIPIAFLASGIRFVHDDPIVGATLTPGAK